MTSEQNAEIYEGQDLEALADIPNYQRWVVESFLPHVRGRVLEVGAGIGNIARLYASRADETLLVEPAANLRPRLEDTMRGFPNTRVVCAMLGDLLGKKVDGNDFSLGSFDVAVLINVLEHIDDDVQMLRDLRSLLRPGGSLALFVPALPWLYGSLDELVHHRRRYTAPSLREVVLQSGFVIESLRYFDILGVVPWLLAGRVMRQRTFNAKAAQLYDRVAVPVGSRAESLFVPPLGKNLLCLARAV